MFWLNIAIAALLVILTAVQATFSDTGFVRGRFFKISTVAMAVLSAFLMATTAIRENAAEERLQAALEGMSKTVFPQDVHFEFISAMRPGGSGVINMNVFAIPSESSLFRRWPVTHTPNELGLGAIYTALRPDFTGLDVVDLIAARGVDYFAFRADTQPGTELRLRLEPGIVPREYRTLDDYRQCQFVCVITGDVDEPMKAELSLKGMRVPFYTVRRDTDWIGSTVFRPTYDRYFR